MEPKTKLYLTIGVLLIVMTILIIIIRRKYISPKKDGDVVKTIRYSKATGKIKSSSINIDPGTNPVLGYLIIIFVVILIFSSLYLTVLRHKLAYQSMRSSNVGIGMSALGSDIAGPSITSLIR